MFRKLNVTGVSVRIGAALAAACLIAGLWLWRGDPSLARALLPPHARWAMRTFNHYRLDYSVSGLITCQVQAEVRAEAVVAARTTPAGGAFCAIMSVTGLFARIDKLSQSPLCGPNGCGCDGPLEIRVVYDTQLGYPALIEQELRPDERWRYFEYWVHNSVGGGCTAVGYEGTRIEVAAPVVLP
jgi:hypothetical protein